MAAGCRPAIASEGTLSSVYFRSILHAYGTGACSWAQPIRHCTDMLLSAQRIHRQLKDIISIQVSQGLHTALLIVPQGRLICTATTFSSELVERGSASEDAEDEDRWLEGPERLRLLLGLASQWEEDESPRMECEVRWSRQTV